MREFYFFKVQERENNVKKRELYLNFISKYKKYETGKMSFLYIYTISLSL